jgi:hypothetical protein
MNLYFTNIKFLDGTTFEGFFDIDNVSAVDYEHSGKYYELRVFMYRGTNVSLFFRDDKQGVAELKEEYLKILEAVKKRNINNQNLT